MRKTSKQTCKHQQIPFDHYYLQSLCIIIIIIIAKAAAVELAS